MKTADVYAGMTGIEQDRVKYLRVTEDVPKPWAPSWVSPEQGDTLGLQNPAVSLKGHFVIKRVHGIVPVADDGSAAFHVHGLVRQDCQIPTTVIGDIPCK